MRRCYAVFWIWEHDCMIEQQRDDTGKVVRPHTIRWRCRKCHRVVGYTSIGANWKLLARLRRQVPAVLERFRSGRA